MRHPKKKKRISRDASRSDWSRPPGVRSNQYKTTRRVLFWKLFPYEWYHVPSNNCLISLVNFVPPFWNLHVRCLCIFHVIFWDWIWLAKLFFQLLFFYHVRLFRYRKNISALHDATKLCLPLRFTVTRKRHLIWVPDIQKTYTFTSFTMRSLYTNISVTSEDG